MATRMSPGADYIEALLSGEPAIRRCFARRVRDSDFGRRFTAGTWPNLPLADSIWPPRPTASISPCRSGATATGWSSCGQPVGSGSAPGIDRFALLHEGVDAFAGVPLIMLQAITPLA